MTIDTACSGGLVPVDVACRSLQSGEMDGAIVACSDKPPHTSTPAHVLGPTSTPLTCTDQLGPHPRARINSAPLILGSTILMEKVANPKWLDERRLDIKADGYIKAEGVNAVIPKRLSDAIRDGDPIRARSSGVQQRWPDPRHCQSQLPKPKQPSVRPMTTQVSPISAALPISNAMALVPRYIGIAFYNPGKSATNSQSRLEIPRKLVELPEPLAYLASAK